MKDETQQDPTTLFDTHEEVLSHHTTEEDLTFEKVWERALKGKLISEVKKKKLPTQPKQ